MELASLHMGLMCLSKLKLWSMNTAMSFSPWITSSFRSGARLNFLYTNSYEFLGPFLSLARSKLRLCSANHRTGYWSNLPCDWPSTAWAYSEQDTENRPWLYVHIRTCLGGKLTAICRSSPSVCQGLVAELAIVVRRYWIFSYHQRIEVLRSTPCLGGRWYILQVESGTRTYFLPPLAEFCQ